MDTIRLHGGDLGSQVLRLRCDLRNASSHVEACYHDDDNWEPTQFQAADCQHRVEGLVKIGRRLAAQTVEMSGDETFEVQATIERGETWVTE